MHILVDEDRCWISKHLTNQIVIYAKHLTNQVVICAIKMRRCEPHETVEIPKQTRECLSNEKMFNQSFGGNMSSSACRVNAHCQKSIHSGTKVQSFPWLGIEHFFPNQSVFQIANPYTRIKISLPIGL